MIKVGNSLLETWKIKSDKEVYEAHKQLESYTLEAQRVVLSEFHRRGLEEINYDIESYVLIPKRTSKWLFVINPIIIIIAIMIFPVFTGLYIGISIPSMIICLIFIPKQITNSKLLFRITMVCLVLALLAVCINAYAMESPTEKSLNPLTFLINWIIPTSINYILLRVILYRRIVEVL